MTQEEIIKLAQAAGFNWPDIQATTIEQRLERFASLVAATEREKFTNTQEFVTLPREVVERALAALDAEDPYRAAIALRAALEQPHTTEQSYMGCVTSDMHELAEWLNTMYEDSKEQIAALEQPQNHVPDAWNMVPDGWKLVPDEPTCGMVLAGEHSMKQHDFFRLDAGYRAMLAAAPQHPTTEQSSAVEQPQVEQKPVAWLHQCNKRPDLMKMSFSKREPTLASKGYKAHPLYTHPQPKREPLTDMQKMMCWSRATHDADVLHKTEHQCLMDYASEIEAAHNIK